MHHELQRNRIATENFICTNSIFRVQRESIGKALDGNSVLKKQKSLLPIIPVHTTIFNYSRQ